MPQPVTQWLPTERGRSTERNRGPAISFGRARDCPENDIYGQFEEEKPSFIGENEQQSRRAKQHKPDSSDHYHESW
jgi:hypothetical protein